jgi:arsenate reductase (thioredoxin)
MKKKVLFICTHNSARSQMAEALLNNIYPDQYQAFSAGTIPGRIDPLVISVMSELGIDMGRYWSKGLDYFENETFDYVITVCDNAKEACPYFAGGKKRLHKSFADPSKLEGDFPEAADKYRKIRDEIKDWIAEEFTKT